MKSFKRRSSGEPKISNGKLTRRAFTAATGASALLLFVTTGGHTIPWLDKLNLFGSHKMGYGPQGVPINKTAKAANVEVKATDPSWKLTVKIGLRSRSYSLEQLRAMKQTTVQLPISCVEGWSQEAKWSGVRVTDLMRAVGYKRGKVTVQSLQRGGYGSSLLLQDEVLDPLTLIALKVNGEVLALNHGFPARLIAPARPGALQTKWLSSLTGTNR